MTYFAIFVGMICGYILRFFKRVSPKKRAPKIRLSDVIAATWRRLTNLVLTLWCGIWRAIGRLFMAIGRFFTAIGHGIRHACYTVTGAWHRWLQRRKEQLLAHDNVYICAKVAQSYSKPNRVVRLIQYSSVKQHCKATGDKYTVVEQGKESTVCLPEFFEKCEEKLEHFPTPEIYIAELHGVEASGGSSILLAKNECLYDPFVDDKDKRLDIKFSNIIGETHGQILVEIAAPSRTVKTGIFMMGFASYNYYHLTIEIMSRLKYIDDQPGYHNLPLIVDEVMLSVPQYQQLIERFNVYKHPLISVKQGEVIHVETLVYPAYNTWMPINVKEREMIRISDFLIAPSALKNVQSYSGLKAEPATDKIFISRKNLSSTRMANEKAVARLFKNNGFKIVYGEDLTYRQQVALFHKAKCVVGTSGAALTNIVYCQPGTDIVCIIPEEYNFYMYSTIAHLLGLQPLFLDARVTKRTAYTASDEFTLDIAYCKRFLSDYAEKEKRRQAAPKRRQPQKTTAE